MDSSELGRQTANLREKRSNQHIKRKERAESTDFARRKIKAGILISRLNKAASGKVELSKSQLEATKLLLDKAMPSLQAVDYTSFDQPESKSEQELIEELRALFFSKPELLSQLGLTFKPGRGPEQPQEPVSDPQQRTAASPSSS